MIKVRVIIQSRVSSSRLPAKALLPLGGLPAAVLCARRAANQQADVIIATSNDKSDDLLVAELQKYHVPFVRGPLDNVLARFVLATQDLQDTDIVVRLTADNVFPDGTFIHKFVEKFKSNESQYVGTAGTSCGLPYGMAVEVFTVGSLREADRLAVSNYDREHVTPWIIRKYSCSDTNWLNHTQCMQHLRCTIDTLDDYIKVATIFANVKDPINELWEELCKRLLQESIKNVKIPVKIINDTCYSEMTLGTVQLGMEYGAANISGKPSLNHSIKIIKTALDAGINMIDSARAYGEAEYRIGQAIKEKTINDLTIITKLDPLDILEDKKIDEKYIKYFVKASIYQSCFELDTKKLHVVLLHNWEHRYLYNEAIWKQLIKFQEKEVIGELGVSINYPHELKQALNEPKIKHIQLPFNMLDWRWKQENIHNLLSKRPDVKIYVRSIFLQGILTASANFWPVNEEIDSNYWIEKIEYCVKHLHRVDKKDLCISYVRSQPWITSIVIGVDNVEQLKQNIEYFRYPVLADDEVLFIEQEFNKVPEVILTPFKWKMSK